MKIKLLMVLLSFSIISCEDKEKVIRHVHVHVYEFPEVDPNEVQASMDQLIEDLRPDGYEE